MSNPLIIGIAGAAGSGKDTLADMLVYRGYACKESFARPLKNMLNGLFGWQESYWNDREWTEMPQPGIFNKSPRELAQTLGTEWARNCISPHFWSDLAITQARKWDFDYVVFSDVRFIEEAEKVDVLIYVTREGTTAVTAHASEQGYESFKHLVDYSFKNNGTLEELMAFAEQVYQVEVAKRG